MITKEQKARNNRRFYYSPKGKAYYAAYRASAHGKARVLRAQLKHHYGISEEDYERMMVAQGRVCAICGSTNADGKRLGVDHDHRTGKVRALLCGSCNSLIGYARESVLVLYKAADYVEKHSR